MLKIERAREGVTLVQLDIPERRNALATPVLRALVDALDAAALDPAVRCVVVTGDDRAFAAGADLGELEDPEAVAQSDRPRLWWSIRRFPKPLIAAVRGWCLGAGNELLMCCDLSVASSQARFGQPETNLGIMPGAGGVATLMRLVGRTRAARMVLTGEPITAEEALQFGLVNELAEPDATLPRALVLAATLAQRAPLALQAAKACLQAGYDLAFAAHIEQERRLYLDLLRSDDKAEGLRAFREKRPPRWQGC
jgi:enoyl-CoA hydratase